MSAHSLEVWKNWKQAQQKYDYFIIGLASALFAFIGSSYSPTALSVTQNSFELCALITLFISIAVGIFRLENDMSLQATKIEQLNAQQKLDTLNQISNIDARILNVDAGMDMSRTELTDKQKILREFVSKSDKGLELISKRCVRYSIVRNFSLLLGFIFLAISKIVNLYIVTNAV